MTNDDDATDEGVIDVGPTDDNRPIVDVLAYDDSTDDCSADVEGLTTDKWWIDDDRSIVEVSINDDSTADEDK